MYFQKHRYICFQKFRVVDRQIIYFSKQILKLRTEIQFRSLMNLYLSNEKKSKFSKFNFNNHIYKLTLLVYLANYLVIYKNAVRFFIYIS